MNTLIDKNQCSHNKRRRRKKLLKCPNSLFEKWLQEWKDEAAEKGLKSYYNYTKALRSLRKYPLPLKNGKEAKLLEHFGDKICSMLDEKLMEYNSQHDTLSTDTVNKVDTNMEEDEQGTCSSARVADACPKKMKNKQLQGQNKREYIPVPRSGGYAIIITLHKYECENQLHLRKPELIDAAQPLCDSSFKVPLPGSHYTAWNCMGHLIKKGLIEKKSSPALYSLTDSGRKLAIQLIERENADCIDKVTVLRDTTVSTSSSVQNSHIVFPPLHANKFQINDDCSPVHDEACHNIMNEDLDYITSQENEKQATAVSSFDLEDISHKKLVPSLQEEINDNTSVRFRREFTLYPGTFDILLCVDNCETSSWASKNRQKEVLTELKNNGVPYDIRKLSVGDFLWIAHENVLPVPGSLQLPPSRELVLNYIVERKRMDDLASSIKDGRFHEQKFRLKNSGLKFPIYLVEEFGKGQHFSLPESSLEQAIVNTQVIDGFTVKRTKNHKESVAYLTLMTRYLRQMFKHQKLSAGTREEIKDPNCPNDIYMTFQQFNFTSLKNKRLTVREMFAKHLLQLHGLSVDKTAAIVENYPSPVSLIQNYNLCSSEEEKENLLTFLKYGTSKRNIGPVLSKVIYLLYNTKGPLS